MTFIELIESVASETNLPKTAVRKVLHTFISKTAEHVLSGNEVRLPSFGRFSKKVIKPKMMFGRQTSERTTIKFHPYI